MIFLFYKNRIEISDVMYKKQRRTSVIGGYSPSGLQVKSSVTDKSKQRRHGGSINPR